MNSPDRSRPLPARPISVRVNYLAYPRAQDSSRERRRGSIAESGAARAYDRTRGLGPDSDLTRPAVSSTTGSVPMPQLSPRRSAAIVPERHGIVDARQLHRRWNRRQLDPPARHGRERSSACAPGRLPGGDVARHVRVPLCGRVPGRSHGRHQRPAAARICGNSATSSDADQPDRARRPRSDPARARCPAPPDERAAARATSSSATDGIRVASPPRVWFDCGRDLDDERFERLTEWVLDHHAVRADAVEPGHGAEHSVGPHRDRPASTG